MFLLDPQHLLILCLLQSDQGLFDLVDFLPIRVMLLGEIVVLSLLLHVGFSLHEEFLC